MASGVTPSPVSDAVTNTTLITPPSLLLKVAINGSYVLLLSVHDSLLARHTQVWRAMMESLKLSSRTYEAFMATVNSADGGVMRVVLVTASLTGEGVTPDAIIQLLSIIQFRGNWYQAGTSSKQYGMPALASHSVIKMCRLGTSCP